MNMKKRVMSAAIVAALGVGSAEAVNLSTTGTGEVLIFPYYTVTGGYETLLSVVNTTDQYKAVKVRFREAMNSREALDFNVYMSPADVWVASVKPVFDTDGNLVNAKVVSQDTTCTAPVIPAEGVEFVTYDIARSAGSAALPTQTDTQLPLDGGPTDASRLTEGYIEIIEMGIADVNDAWGPDPLNNVNDLPFLTVWDRNGNGVPDAKHIETGNGVMPDNCEGLRDNWRRNGGPNGTAGYWVENVTHSTKRAMLPPTGGLMGSVGLIQKATGVEIGVEPVTLAEFSDTVIHANPGFSFPTLGDVSPAKSVVMDQLGGVGLQEDLGVTDLGSLRVTVDNWASAAGDVDIDAVTAVLQAHSIMNEFTVNPAAEAETAWVVTFPTKRFYADAVTDFPTRQGRHPFVNDFVDNNVYLTDDWDDQPISGRGEACESADAYYWNREEMLTGGCVGTGCDIQFSPTPVGEAEITFDLCNEVNVVNFNLVENGNKVAASDPFGSNVAVDFNMSAQKEVDGSYRFKNGWAHLVFQTPPSADGVHTGHNHVNNLTNRAYTGLPAVGFRTTVLGNSVSFEGPASYGVSAPHRYVKDFQGYDWANSMGVAVYDATLIVADPAAPQIDFGSAQ